MHTTLQKRVGRQALPALASDAADTVVFFDEAPMRSPASYASALEQPPLVRDLVASSNLATRRDVICTALRRIGFDSVLYVRINVARGMPVPTSVCVAHGSGAWARRYFARRFYRVDPRLHTALRSSLPLRWSREQLLEAAQSISERDSGVDEMAAAMQEAGLQRGVMLALAGPGPEERSIVSLSARDDSGAIDGDAMIGRVLMFAMSLHEFYGQYVLWPRAQTAVRPNLSERQDQILLGLSRGWTDREIAEALDLTMYGVDYHLRRLRQHFNVRNRVELIQEAFRARGS